ncbi:MAG: menaquinone-dependent protoporphyrinogen IX dehydrogenase [Gammaproteobacteria bacterium]|nr:menaquinone-dependent protoporphyrinogen IX dehydrogenase [Gammaproteobacteria bacterium]MDH5308683.1 menaquinone-dependent protoporphyrinogen IX dehydrogenase [Gammaproteobacteria bacterium]
MRVLLLYSTIDGHTRDICARLKEMIDSAGHRGVLAELSDKSEINVGEFDGVILGASIRYGRHRPAVARFIDRHTGFLESRPCAFFSVNAVARKPEKQSRETNPYVRKFLRSISWRPGHIGIFGGLIDYPRYGFIDRNMIRLIMWITKGPTDPAGTYDFTNWDDVETFGEKYLQMLQSA